MRDRAGPVLEPYLNGAVLIRVGNTVTTPCVAEAKRPWELNMHYLEEENLKI